MIDPPKSRRSLPRPTPLSLDAFALLKLTSPRKFHYKCRGSFAAAIRRLANLPDARLPALHRGLLKYGRGFHRDPSLPSVSAPRLFRDLISAAAAATAL